MTTRTMMSVSALAAVVVAVTAAAEPAHPGRPHQWTDDRATPGRCVTGAASGSGLLFVADREEDLVYALKPDTGAVMWTFPTPGYIPQGLAHDGVHLWIADADEKRIYQLDPSDGTVLHSFESPCSTPAGLAHDGTDLWLLERKKQRLLRLSTVDGTTIRDLPAPATASTGMTWDGTHLWIADRLQDEVYRVDPDNGNVVVTLQAGGEHPWGLAWVDGRLVNADYQADRLLSLAPADLPRYALLEDRYEEIVFHHELRSYGPEPIEEAELAIAIPVNRPGQEIVGSIAFEPAPTEMGEDSWGQNVARFVFRDVKAPGKVGAVMRLRAHTWTIRYYLMPENVGELKDIPRDIRKQYLADGDKYRIEDPVIQGAVRDVLGDTSSGRLARTNAYEVMRALYDHVLEHMEYELAGGWNVAPAVLERGSGSCSEYAFVFIALCRAAGLPARYVGSVARRGDDASVDDVFHRWTEVYLPPYGWIPVDPSRGDKPSPYAQALGIGQVDNTLVVTTESGGASEDLGWYYNSASRVRTKGRAKVVEEVYAEWEPPGGSSHPTGSKEPQAEPPAPNEGATPEEAPATDGGGT